MNGLHSIPPMDTLLSDPSKATALPPESARALLASIAGLVPVLIAQACKETGAVASIPSDSCIDKEQVAALIGMSVSWVEKNAEALPPRRSVAGVARWVKSEVVAWVKARPLWGKGD